MKRIFCILVLTGLLTGCSSERECSELDGYSAYIIISDDQTMKVDVAECSVFNKETFHITVNREYMDRESGETVYSLYEYIVPMENVTFYKHTVLDDNNGAEEIDEE